MAKAKEGTKRSFSIKSMLIPLLRRPRVSQFVKWSVYSLLIVNFGVYFYDDWMAYQQSIAAGAPLSEVLETFATTIDMAAWLGLVFLFEFETYVLPDEAFKGWVPKAFIALRVIFYAAIFYAAYGYTINSLDNFDTESIAGVTSLCQVAGENRALQIDVITFVDITPQNCAELSGQETFYKIADNVSLIDGPVLGHVQKMGWIDIVNAYVWIIVVFLIEVAVWLQATDRFGGRALRLVDQLTTALYGILIIDALIWLFTGYFIYAWDSFLWIFGFWAIELNLAEWEQERVEELAAAG
jgi:hypothetical protein